MDILTFEIKGDCFGIPIEKVAFIEGRWDTAAGTSGAPDYIKEIILLHGLTVPIYDLASLLGYAEQKMKYVVILNIEDMQLGLALSGASEVITVDESEIYPVPVTVNTARHCLKNVICCQGKLIGLIDVDRLIPQEKKEK